MFSLQLCLSNHLRSHNYHRLSYIPKLTPFSLPCALLPSCQSDEQGRSDSQGRTWVPECLLVFPPVLECPFVSLLTYSDAVLIWFLWERSTKETSIGSCWHSWSFLRCHLRQRMCWCCLKLCEGLQKAPLCTNDGATPLKLFLLIV